MSKDSVDGSPGGPRQAEPDVTGIVAQAIARLRFGGILLTVHEGKLVQMEITEKHRFV